MKSFSKIGLALLVALATLFIIDRFILAGHFELRFLAWMHGKGSQGKNLASHLFKQDKEHLMPLFTEALALKNINTANQEKALVLADIVKDDPLVKEQLLILSQHHPNKLIRCFWRKRIKAGHEFIMISGQGDQQVSTKFVMHGEDCELEIKAHSKFYPKKAL